MANRQELEEAIIAFVRTKSKVTGTITESMHFRDDLELDSMDLTELVFLLEDLIGEGIEDAALIHLTTIRSALDFFDRKQGAVS